jgi:TonB family protein
MRKDVVLLFVFAAATSLVHAQAPANPVQPDKGDATRPVEIGSRIGGPVTAPVLIHSASPDYTAEARAKKFNGNVQVYLWIDPNGNPSHVRVVRGVGMGLDEKAVEAVRQYKFKPAMQDGKPVKVDMYIDVNFSLF